MDFALKGQEKSAQGEALGKGCKENLALKGRDKKRMNCFALTGL